MKYSLIDYENLKGNRIKRLSFDENETLYIFYTDSDTKIDMDVIAHITKYTYKVHFFHVENGMKNALDFQLSTFLGYLIGKNSETNNNEYIIYSDDKGFDRVVSFWKNNYKVNICRKGNSIITPTTRTNNTENSVDTFFNTPVRDKEFPHITKKDIRGLNLLGYENQILDICSRSFTKEQIHNSLEYIIRDSKRTAYIYNQLRPILIERGYS